MIRMELNISCLILKLIVKLFEASDGLQAIELSTKLEFDIIFMDISMPNMDGITATGIIMKNNSNNKIISHFNAYG